MKENENKNSFKKDGFIFSFNDEIKTANIVDTYSLSGDIIIPRSIVFSNQEFIIKSIETNSFRGANIRSIQFAEDSEIQMIEKAAFSNSRIESLVIPSSLTCLKDAWRYQADSLTKVTVMPNNEYYKNCELNDNLVIGRSSKDSPEFDELVFVSSNLTSFTIPPYIKVIGSCSFQNSKLEEISIPSHVTRIDSFAFFQSNLKRVDFEKDSQLQLIGKAAFFYNKFVNFFVPSHVTKICANAFNNCQKLEEVQFADDSELKIIENGAFESTALKTVSIPSHVTKICKQAFAIHELTNVIFSQDSELDTIEERSFCLSLIECLTIPPKVEHFGLDMLDKFKRLTINSNNKYFKNHELDENLVVGRSSKDSSEFDVIVFLARDATEVVVPSNIKKILPFAFGFCNIRSIKIPLHQTEICSNAFYGCEQLNNIEIPSDSELRIIGEYAFDKCSFEAIYIPSNVEHIMEYAFSGCMKLKTVEITNDSKLQTIGEKAFHCSLIEALTIPANVSDISGICKSDVPNLKKVTIMPNNEYMKNYEFDENLIIRKSSKEGQEFDELVFVSKGITKVTIPSIIKIISTRSFAQTRIKNIFIPSNVIKICAGAFENCKQMKQVEFAHDSQINIIEDGLFSFLPIDNINIPSNVIEIGKYSFNFCRNLKSVLIPYECKLEIIREGAFTNSSIESIFIPSSVKKIENDAFKNCYNLKIIEIGCFNKDLIDDIMIHNTSNAIIMIPHAKK